MGAVWNMRRDRLRFFWADRISRLRINRLWCGQVTAQVLSSRSTFRNSTSLSATADTSTCIGSPGAQAYASANTRPGPMLSSMLWLPHRSSLSTCTRPDSTRPKLCTSSPIR